MPELPEVESMAAGLREVLIGRTLQRIRVLEKGSLRKTSPRSIRQLEGCRILGLSRRGKFILFHLSNGSVLLFHLKMTGRFDLPERSLPPGRWERLLVEFEGWDRRLSFVDQRKFGYLTVIAEEEDCPVPLVYELGPDALRVSRRELRDILEESGRPVKALLLDQRVLAGLGNIYVDESLHGAGIHPGTPAAEITREKMDALHRCMRRILKRAIQCGGSSVRSYRDSRGEPGSFQKHHRVYGKKGEKCPRCQSTITYARVASRGTHFCPVCQRPPRRKPKGPSRHG